MQEAQCLISIFGTFFHAEMVMKIFPYPLILYFVISYLGKNVHSVMYKLITKEACSGTVMLA